MPVRRKTKKNKKTLWYLEFGIWNFLFVALGLFLLLNILASQIISPLYAQITNEERPAVVNFLRNIRFLPEFPVLLSVFGNTYDNGIEDKVFAQEKAQKKMIKNLEQILDKNRKARDVLYSLFLLYGQIGNQEKAQQYLQQAKAVDPNITN